MYVLYLYVYGSWQMFLFFFPKVMNKTKKNTLLKIKRCDDGMISFMNTITRLSGLSQFATIPQSVVSSLEIQMCIQIDNI